MKKLLVIFFAVFATILFVAPKSANAWFGAGSALPLTSNGLRGEIALPEYKFSPDFYNIGDTVTINVRGFNTGSEAVTSNYVLTINKVNEAPIGTNISDGTPTTPGINENDLFNFHQASNDVQSFVTSIDLGSQVFLPSEWHTFGGSYVTSQPGYYQFSFIDTSSEGEEVESGNLLATGFFRVLSSSNNPTPTPNPTEAPKDPDVCANIDGLQSSVPDGLHLDASGRNCVAFEYGGPPQSGGTTGGQVLGSSSKSGQVLGVTSMAKTGIAETIVGYVLTVFGLAITVISLYAYKKQIAARPQDIA